MDQTPVKKSPLPIPGGDPPSTLYQYVPTGPVVLAPLVEHIDLKQQQIDLLLKQGQELQALLATQQQQIASLTDILCQLKNR